MNLVRRSFVVAALSGALIATAYPAAALAQAFPSRVITIIVAAAPGSSTDPLARMLASILQTRLKQPVVVVNRVGAGGYVGAEFVARAAPDGYTLLFTTDTAMHSNLFFKEQRNLIQELVPIKIIATQPLGLLVSSGLGVSNLQEFVEVVKANPKKYNYGYVVNTAVQLESERLLKSAGMEMTGVSYSSTAPAVQALMAGDIQFVLSSLSTMKPVIDAGKGTVLALSSQQRFSQLPNVPTAKEQGLDMDLANRTGLFGSSKIPPAILELLYREVVASMETPEMKDLLKNLSLEPMPGSMDDQKKQLIADSQHFADIAKAIGIERQ